ncbi:MAG TPA: WYL domain-containing protein [Alphaproteobacteria bacterium]
MINDICDAIHKRKRLRLTYRGGARVVEPYAYGTDAGGAEILRGYQLSGHSESGAPRAWKLFRVAEIGEVAVLEDTFPGPRQGYLRNDPSMSSVYCEI